MELTANSGSDGVCGHTGTVCAQAVPTGCTWGSGFAEYLVYHVTFGSFLEPECTLAEQRFQEEEPESDATGVE